MLVHAIAPVVIDTPMHAETSPEVLKYIASLIPMGRVGWPEEVAELVARLTKATRKKADACASFLINKAPYLDYPTALAAGWPIATGIIEGTCRYLVADRMDITGARWSVDGAEAVLKLRAVRSNDDYWRFHHDHERQRVHESCYADGIIPSPRSRSYSAAPK